ncbi:MAG: 2OG-Fe(II) oxygenase [Deltaproteobacteria bacterium]|nr:2OG-Fe(II) oxygenase [Deltaproteobacteria bacterium]
MIDEIAEALAALNSKGTFATGLTCPSSELQLRVEGVGPIHFPVSSATAKKLAKLAQPALFGKRTRTIYDPEVRDTGEIPAKQIRVDGCWARALELQLEHIRRRLGLSAETRLEAKLDKLLVYGPGQFFAPHQDSERSNTMIGTLVVELPSSHQGGAVVVEHRGAKRTFSGARRGNSELSLLAFYADCRHEVKRVEHGYRITLTYQLHAHALSRRGGTAAVRVPAVERLAESVRAYFATPVSSGYGSAPLEGPDRLIYLLDHEYSERSLAWNRLKNGDCVRAQALREVARPLDCEIHLALADVHENWACADGEDGYGDRYDEENEGDEDDVDEGEEEGDYELLDLLDTDLELRHLVAADGSKANARIRPSMDEVCFARASHELKPFRTEHEGYMGNYGNTVDRWYHRAAVVLWPRARSFFLRAKAEPSWAIAQIARLLRSGQTEQARQRLAEVLIIWEQSVRGADPAVAALPVLKLARELDDAELAARLLGPLGLTAMTGAAAETFSESVEHFGPEWGRRLVVAWTARPRYDASDWRPGFARLGGALRAAGESARELGIWMLVEDMESLRDDLAHFQEEPSRPRRSSERFVLEHARQLLETAVALDASRSGDELARLLADPTEGLPAATAVALLKRLAKDFRPAATRAMRLAPLHERLVRELAAQVRSPARADDDWSIALKRRCDCELCVELGQFLRAPEQIELRWPVSAEKRQHVHHAIDDDELPVSHQTERRGSPYTLVLKKLPALFACEAKARAEHEAQLAWLEKNRGRFVE